MLGTAGSPGEMVVLEGWLVGDDEGLCTRRWKPQHPW